MIKSNRLLIMLALLTVYSIARGATNAIEPAGAGYFVVDYSDGFIRRGLVGQIFSLVFLRNQASAAWAAAVVIHHLLVMLVGAGLLAWLWSTMWTTRLFTPGRLVAIYCLFAASEFLPTLLRDLSGQFRHRWKSQGTTGVWGDRHGSPNLVSV